MGRQDQAAVHLWRPIRPRVSTEDGIASWSETATAVALRLLPNSGRLFLVPYALDDLFGMTFRPTPWIERGRFRDRVAEKQIQERGPHVHVIESPS